MRGIWRWHGIRVNDGNPFGRILTTRGDRTFEVVGVARTANYYQLGEDPFPQTYFSVEQVYEPQVHFLVHTSGSA